VQAMMDYRLLSILKGQTDEAPSYESVKNYKYSSEELRHVQYNRQRMVVGTPDVVKEKMLTLARNFDVEEIVVATFADKREDRLRSYHYSPRFLASQATRRSQPHSSPNHIPRNNRRLGPLAL
jgi:alkanesulfonate monooxygenase SsuD/methylene tetrahydromethanopterin reductase-like flavin-dependent oxidoreductase (luciferase family)